MERALLIRAKELGEDNPDTVSTRNNLELLLERFVHSWGIV